MNLSLSSFHRATLCVNSPKGVNSHPSSSPLLSRSAEKPLSGQQMVPDIPGASLLGGLWGVLCLLGPTS